MNRIATALRVGFAEAIAYRAELFVWILATNMPLVMWLLWSTVAEEAPIGRFGPAQFAAYFLVTLVVRLMTGAWVGWQMNDEVRRGALQQRLLRPFPTFAAYALENMGAMPLRFAMLAPVLVFTAIYVPASEFSASPWQWALAPLTIAAAWAINFSAMLVIGTLSLYWQSSLAIFDLWMGAYFVFSGYLIPLALYPAWMQRAVTYLPFRYMMSLPVETILGHINPQQSVQGFLVQLLFVAGFLGLATLLWKKGLRQYGAFGG